MFSRRYVLQEDARPVTELANFRRESCDFTVDGVRMRVSRERGKRFVLDGPGGRIASADRESGKRWAVTTSAGLVELVRPSVWRSTWELHRGGQAVGRVEPDRGLFTRSSHADLPTDLPLAVRVFAYYVVLMLWERAAASAAAAS